MELVLWRHAEAEEGTPDEERALTEKGRREAKKMAAFLRNRLSKDTHILVSPARRAEQTAEALAEHFQIEPRVGSGASAHDILQAAGWPDDPGCVLVVGHQPCLGEVAALLLADSSTPFSVRKGGVWWFSRREREGDFQTNLRLVISPEFLP